MKTKIWILTALAVVFIALTVIGLDCRPNSSAKRLFDRETFISLYVDLEIVAEKVGIGTPEYEAVRDSILTSYGTTFDDVTAMLTAYDAEPEKWAEIWEGILAELEQRKAGATASDSTTTD